MKHELKCWPEFYDAVASGVKTFEIRKNDRGYQVGDTLLLHRYDPQKQEYTGESITRTVTYILPLETAPGVSIENGTVVMGLQLPDWTPCAEGMPESDAKYSDGTDIKYWLALHRDCCGFVIDYTEAVWFSKDMWMKCEGGFFDKYDDAIAWQPLPAPYRADDTTGKVKED